jgi:hypothetical protein
VAHFVPPIEAESFTCPDGAIAIWFPAPNIVAARATGFVTGRATKAAYARIDAEPRFPNVGFLDLSRSSGFDWNARMRVLRWNVQHLNADPSFHLLIVPRFVIPTRLLAHLLRDRVEFHLDPASFEAAYALAIRRKTRTSIRAPQ